MGSLSRWSSGALVWEQRKVTAFRPVNTSEQDLVAAYREICSATGHALPWNPMQPLMEHVMMCRPCGGGGERGFDMPRYKMRKGRFLHVAGSTTIR